MIRFMGNYVSVQLEVLRSTKLNVVKYGKMAVSRVFALYTHVSASIDYAN